MSQWCEPGDFRVWQTLISNILYLYIVYTIYSTGELGYDRLNGTRKIGPSYAKSVIYIWLILDMHRTGTKHILCHMQKFVVQWSVISKFTCITMQILVLIFFEGDTNFTHFSIFVLPSSCSSSSFSDPTGARLLLKRLSGSPMIPTLCKTEEETQQLLWKTEEETQQLLCKTEEETQQLLCKTE